MKNQIENDPGSYFSKKLIHGFSDSLNTAFIISAGYAIDYTIETKLDFVDILVTVLSSNIITSRSVKVIK